MRSSESSRETARCCVETVLKIRESIQTAEARTLVLQFIATFPIIIMLANSTRRRFCGHGSDVPSLLIELLFPRHFETSKDYVRRALSCERSNKEALRIIYYIWRDYSCWIILYCLDLLRQDFANDSRRLRNL